MAKQAKKANKQGVSTAGQVGIGIGLTAAAVAAAGAYFLYGSEKAPQNRQKVRSWMLKAKAEVLEQLEDAKKMSREEFEALVAGAASTYAKTKKATKKDIASFAAEMMQHWDTLEATMVKKPKKKPAAKKAPAKKAPAKKTPAKKAVAKKKPTAKMTTKKKTEK